MDAALQWEGQDKNGEEEDKSRTWILDGRVDRMYVHLAAASSTRQPFQQMMCHDHLNITEKCESVVAADMNKSMRFIRETGTITAE